MVFATKNGRELLFVRGFCKLNFSGIIWGFFGDVDVVGVAFTQARGGYFYELGVVV